MPCLWAMSRFPSVDGPGVHPKWKLPASLGVGVGMADKASFGTSMSP